MKGSLVAEVADVDLSFFGTYANTNPQLAEL